MKVIPVPSLSSLLVLQEISETTSFIAFRILTVKMFLLSSLSLLFLLLLLSLPPFYTQRRKAGSLTLWMDDASISGADSCFSFPDLDI